MKVLVISDIHGSSYYARKIEEIVEKENPEKVVVYRKATFIYPRLDKLQ